MSYVRRRVFKRRYPFRRSRLGVFRKRRRVFGRRRYRIRRFPVGFPQRMLRKLCFYDSYNESSGGSTFFIRVFRGSSIYDPDYTGAGTNASGVTNYSRMFQRYRVLAAKIRVTFHAAETYPCLCGIYANEINNLVTAGASGTSFENVVCEVGNRRNSRHGILQGTGNAMRPLTLSLYVRSRDMLMNARDDDASAEFGQNPSKGWGFAVGFMERLIATTAVDVSYDVKVTYYCMFTGVNPANYDN